MVMPMSSFGMNSYSMGGYGMGTSQGNAYQEVKNRYGCGHIDFGHRPIIAGYPVEVNPMPKERSIMKTWFGRIFHKLYD